MEAGAMDMAVKAEEAASEASLPGLQGDTAAVESAATVVEAMAQAMEAEAMAAAMVVD